MERLGIIGAGTMGAGIALAALYVGLDVTFYDLDAGVLEQAQQYLAEFLGKKNQLAALDHFRLSETLTSMADRDLVIEAVIENLEVKQALFAQLEAICSPQAILTTNTSTLSVTAISANLTYPHRVAGLHFFNPAPVMKLVEVVKTGQTDAATLEQVTRLAERLGKIAIVVKDSPGFVVNRVARPFYLEALRIVAAGQVSLAQVDEVMQYGAGFRMGPFRLMDLIGLDVSLAASQSVYDQTQAARFRPSEWQKTLVKEGRLGRKAGRGFYDYGENIPAPTPPTFPTATPQHGAITAIGQTALAKWAVQHGYQLSSNPAQVAIVAYHQPLPSTAELIFMDCAAGTPTGENIIPYDDCLLDESRLITLIENPLLSPDQRQQAETFLAGIGLGVRWLPHMVISRVVCQIINEAAFALGEGVAAEADIDTAMLLGVSYPRAPFEWLHLMGLERVLTVLDQLAQQDATGYQPAPLLLEWGRRRGA